MKLSLPKLFTRVNLFITCLLIAGCTFEKESRFNRSMQNLTARYNILFNANDMLRQKQVKYADLYPDNYSKILDVYPDTAGKSSTPDKDLEAVIVRGNKIISEKDQSHYIGDAYLILGKANFLEGKYFNATEFFSYVVRTFPKEKNLTQDALVWKARSLMHTNELNLADSVLDTAMIRIFPKQENIADVYATRLQYDIYTEKYTDAEQMAKQAVHYTHDTGHRLRWTFILAQIQELNHKLPEAYKNYSSVENSNAQFEMSFNAGLNRIRVQQSEGGLAISRIDLLKKLLKDDKNADFIDQIYYQIAEIYYEQKNITEAIKNYNFSIRKSTRNMNQRGLSYLRLAEINFNVKADYSKAKKYYDSTLNSLSPGFPGYQAILKKANNLQLLADRLQIISREDTLQMLAKLDEKARAAKIKQLAAIAIAQQQQQQQASAATAYGGGIPANNNQPSRNAGAGGNSNFYFNNPGAISQGYTDFKRVWGNRPLTDNWRISVKAGSASGTQPSAPAGQGPGGVASGNQAQNSAANSASLKIQQDLQQNIPLTPAQLAQSNNRIYNAYLDIGNFYRDIVDDKKEAIATYELLLSRFPNNVNKAVLYYNLYRLYSDTDPAKSEIDKNIILKDYPESDFAKIILDPDYTRKLNDKNAEFTLFYTRLFDLIAKRKYPEAVIKADELIRLYPASTFLAQVYYLRALALGHGQTLEPFKLELDTIIQKFPNDRLIAPLIKQHLTYIADNRTELAARPVILVDGDSTEVPFMLRQQKFNDTPYYPNNVVYAKPQNAIAKTTSPVKPANVPPAPVPAKTDSSKLGGPLKKDSLAKGTPAKPDAPSIFSLKDSTNYYFVVNVSTNRVNLAPSRFGIGQFNRANFQNSPIKHQLKNVGANQLIYVGRFGSLIAAKAYARAIAPLLPEIMNVTADKYTFFIITQQNLDKLADKTTLDSYFDFYQKNY